MLGRCRDCKTRISPRYPVIEAAGAVFAVICLWFFGLALLALLAFGVIMVLLAIATIDFNTSEIPDSLIIALVPFAIASIWLLPDVSIFSHAIGLVAISLPMLLLTLIVPGAFGGGDIKLIAVCGFLLGWQLTLLAFFIALMLGGGTAIYLLASGKRKRGQHMVFGPAICAGTIIALFYGKDIIAWYLQMYVLWVYWY